MALPDKKRIEKIRKQIDKLASKGKDYKFEYYKLVDEIVLRGDYAYFEQTLTYEYQIDISKYSNNLSLIKKYTWEPIMFSTNNTFQQKLKKLYNQRKVFQQSYYVYSDAITTVGLSMSSPLTSTYSISGSTQSITTTRTGNNIFFSTNDPEVFKMEIYKCDWSTTNGINSPVERTVELFQEINIGTQSSYKTEIATTHGREYLVKTIRRGGVSDFKTYNYKFIVSINSYLGTIVEDEVFAPESKYFIQNKLYASLIGLKKTFLNVTKADGTSLYINAVYLNTNEENSLINRYTIALDFLLS